MQPREVVRGKEHERICLHDGKTNELWGSSVSTGPCLPLCSPAAAPCLVRHPCPRHDGRLYPSPVTAYPMGDYSHISHAAVGNLDRRPLYRRHHPLSLPGCGPVSSYEQKGDPFAPFPSPGLPLDNLSPRRPDFPEDWRRPLMCFHYPSHVGSPAPLHIGYPCTRSHRAAFLAWQEERAARRPTSH